MTYNPEVELAIGFEFLSEITIVKLGDYWRLLEFLIPSNFKKKGVDWLT